MFRRLVWASLAARRARVGLAFMAVTLGIGVAIALGTLALQVGDDLARNLRKAGPNFVLLPEGASWPLESDEAGVRVAQGGASLAERSVADMKDVFWRNNILEAAPEMAAGAAVRAGAHGTVSLTVVGTWFDHTVDTPDGPWRTGLVRLRPQWQLQGAWPRDGEAEVAVGRALAGRLSIGPNSRVFLESEGATVEARVSGVIQNDESGEARVWAPLALAQALAGRPGEVDRVWFSALVFPEPPGPPPDPAMDLEGFERYMCTAYPANIAAELTDRIAGAEARPLTEIVAGEAHVVSRLNLLMLLLGLAGLASSVLGLVSTTTAAVVERSVEIGLLRSMGAGPVQISGLLLGETALVALAGGLAGWLTGSLAARAIRGDVFGPGAALEPALLPIALALSLAVALLGTLAPLRLALRVNPAEALRG